MASREPPTGITSSLVSRLDQSITFAPLSDRLLSRSPFTVSATASTGLPVTFQMVGGPVTLNGNPVTLMSPLDAGNRLRRFVTVA